MNDLVNFLLLFGLFIILKYIALKTQGATLERAIKKKETMQECPRHFLFFGHYRLAEFIASADFCFAKVYP